MSNGTITSKDNQNFLDISDDLLERLETQHKKLFELRIKQLNGESVNENDIKNQEDLIQASLISSGFIMAVTTLIEATVNGIGAFVSTIFTAKGIRQIWLLFWIFICVVLKTLQRK